ncbi:hypothetical protein [Virgibacillus litoralis]|uniref:Uncharacterized protein n=1 Tax=Virgibacillus litoralis TaxID=578221 RepID=A0ABS4HEK4_9BACI|nr:hypothetical protein [Virgibacillus litoralis]MBP1949347.1 hypothetical protein [Virgibacillus litoralis]
MEKKEVAEVKKQIEEFRNLFKDNPVQHIQEGTWFTKVLQMALNDSPQNLDAKFFNKKYIGLSNEQKAKQLVKATSNYTAIAGGCAAGVVSAGELSTMITGGWSLTVVGASLIGEISYITYLQLKLVYEVSVLLDAKLNRDDPEDIITLFWFALGVNIWEDVSNTILKTGPRSAEYLGRKALRAGVRQSIKKMVAKVGGTKLAGKITERALLKLIVPGINIPIATFVNKKFTSNLGKIAIKKFKIRGATIPVVENLLEIERYYAVLTIPLIYHVGIFDNNDKKGLTEVIQVQSNTTKRISLTNDEENLIDEINQIDFNDFCDLLADIKGETAKELIVDLTAYTSIIKGDREYLKMDKILESLSITEKIDLEKYKKRLGI